MSTLRDYLNVNQFHAIEQLIYEVLGTEATEHQLNKAAKLLGEENAPIYRELVEPAEPAIKSPFQQAYGTAE